MNEMFSCRRGLRDALSILMCQAFAGACQGPEGPAGSNGLDGADWVDPNPFPIEEAGVVGLVTDRSGDALAGGTVYFVPASGVDALPATTIAVDSPDDEPLEDVIAANGTGYPQATVDATGIYALPTLQDGTWFVTYVPDALDTEHLPGGSLCRTSRASADMVGTRLDIEVSEVPPEDANYVGTGICVGCHSTKGTHETMHSNGIWSPYSYDSPLQDTDREDLWLPLETKFEPSTTVWFYAYDSSRKFDKYKTSETNPGSGVSFTVTVQKVGDDYQMLLHNVANLLDPDRVIRMDAIYGGGILKERYLTKIVGGAGFYYTTMPLQFNHEGSEASNYGRTSKVWRDYHGDWWYDETAKTFKTPAASKSFEKNCISCHAVGVRVTGSDADGWTAHTLVDAEWGDFDYDGDGRAEDMNIGCESCHGPGSTHWEDITSRGAIVSPDLLTPERESLICAPCHSRPKGANGTDCPVDAEGWMMRPGISRNEFLRDFATTQLDGDPAGDFYADDRMHSKSHHQQYSDFIRSRKYKNGTELMTCSTCHDAHGSPYWRDLVADPDDNEAMCGGTCHGDFADDQLTHIATELGLSPPEDYSVKGAATCSQCHMPYTAKTGSGTPGESIEGIEYWQGDISSHIFDVPDKAWSATTSLSMPTPYTNSCATDTCHVSISL